MDTGRAVGRFRRGPKPSVVIQTCGRRPRGLLASSSLIILMAFAEAYFNGVDLADAAIADQFAGAVEMRY